MKRPEDLKIIHFHFGRDGGAERFFINLVNGLSKRGVQQKTVMRPDRIWKPMVADATDIIESHFRNLSLDRLFLPRKIRQLNEEWKPDAMIAWTPKGSVLMQGTLYGIKIARLGDYPHSLKRLREIDSLVANAPDIIKRVKSLGWKKPASLISNFTSTEKIKPVSREQFGVPRGAFLVVALGRFVKRKGFDTLIRTIAKLPDAYLLLVGEGEERLALESLASALEISHRVQLLTWVNDTRPFIAACDVFALPSIHEPLGNVALEAWAQGKPLVSTRSEGPSWYIQDGENGLLVDIGDSDSFAAACNSIREKPDLRDKLINGGTKSLQTNFSEKVIIDRYIELIRSFESDLLN